MRNFINVGFNNLVALEDIVAITVPEGATNKRNIAKAKEENRIIDATHGRKTRSIIYTNSPYIVLSSLQTETLEGRLADFIKGVS